MLCLRSKASETARQVRQRELSGNTVCLNRPAAELAGAPTHAELECWLLRLCSSLAGAGSSGGCLQLHAQVRCSLHEHSSIRGTSLQLQDATGPAHLRT